MSVYYDASTSMFDYFAPLDCLAEFSEEINKLRKKYGYPRKIYHMTNVLEDSRLQPLPNECQDDINQLIGHICNWLEKNYPIETSNGALFTEVPGDYGCFVPCLHRIGLQTWLWSSISRELAGCAGSAFSLRTPTTMYCITAIRKLCEAYGKCMQGAKQRIIDDAKKAKQKAIDDTEKAKQHEFDEKCINALVRSLHPEWDTEKKKWTTAFDNKLISSMQRKVGFDKMSKLYLAARVRVKEKAKQIIMHKQREDYVASMRHHTTINVSFVTSSAHPSRHSSAHSSASLTDEDPV